MNPFHRFCPALLVLFVFLGPALSAQHEPLPEEATPEEVFLEVIGIEIVNIDAVVTDRKGRLVEGLTRDDFTLRIDGTAVPIANFYAVAGAGEPRPTPPAAAATADPAAPAPSVQPNDVVVYLDSFYLGPGSRRRVLRDLPAYFEEQLAAGARIMLINRVRAPLALTTFTTDLDELLAALAQAGESPMLGLQQTQDRRRTLDSILELYVGCTDPCENCLDTMIGLARNYGESVLHERRASAAALGLVVNALGVLEGRKALLYVSDGIQQQPAVDLFYHLGQLCPRQAMRLQEYVLRMDVGDLTDLVAQANASRVTLYALEAVGLRSFSKVSAEYTSTALLPSPENDMIRFANLQGSLFFIANETGGKAILNANRLAPDLSRLTGELGTYYSLGYRPQHVGRGRTHRVGLKVAKKGYRVRFRRSFLHKKPEQQLADRALGAVLFGAVENPLAAEVRPGTQSPPAAGRVTVPLEISVPYDKLTLIPGDGGRQGRLTVVVAAPGEKAKRLAIRKKEIAVSPSREATAEERYRFGVNVELETGEYLLAVGIWDEIAATGSFLSVRVVAEAASVDDGP